MGQLFSLYIFNHLRIVCDKWQTLWKTAFCISRAWQAKILNRSINTTLPETPSAPAHRCLLQGHEAAGEPLHNAAHSTTMKTQGRQTQGLFIQKVT